MQRIVPHLWFDDTSTEAAAFYVQTFGKNSSVTHTSIIRNTPSGDCDFVQFSLRGFEFMGISGGPAFRINPCISFMVNFDPSRDADAAQDIDRVWNALIDGGKALMNIGEYPFSKRYGWVEDTYGVNWQLILTNPDGEPRPPIMPSIMFTGDNTGKAGEAIDFYVSTFKDAKRGLTAEYPPGASPEPAAKIMFAEFMLENQWFTAMDSGHMHEFGFNEAVSLLVRCDTQEEIDALMNRLSAVPEAEQCGWLKDKYGVSWQMHPTAWEAMMKSGDQPRIDRALKAFLAMKRVNIAALKKAFDGE